MHLKLLKVLHQELISVITITSLSQQGIDYLKARKTLICFKYWSIPRRGAGGAYPRVWLNNLFIEKLCLYSKTLLDME